MLWQRHDELGFQYPTNSCCPVIRKGWFMRCPVRLRPLRSHCNYLERFSTHDVLGTGVLGADCWLYCILSRRKNKKNVVPPEAINEPRVLSHRSFCQRLCNDLYDKADPVTHRRLC